MGYVYVIQFSTGGVKVGQSRNPERRIADHRDGARAYGSEVVATWISPEHQNVAENERKLIAFCRQHWSRVRAEYFPAADFGLVAEHAETLTFEPRVSEPTPKVADPESPTPRFPPPPSSSLPMPIHDPDWFPKQDFVPVGGGWNFPRDWYSAEVLRAWDAEEARLRTLPRAERERPSHGVVA